MAGRYPPGPALNQDPPKFAAATSLHVARSDEVHQTSRRQDAVTASITGTGSRVLSWWTCNRVHGCRPWRAAGLVGTGSGDGQPDPAAVACRRGPAMDRPAVTDAAAYRPGGGGIRLRPRVHEPDG